MFSVISLFGVGVAGDPPAEAEAFEVISGAKQHFFVADGCPLLHKNLKSRITFIHKTVCKRTTIIPGLCLVKLSAPTAAATAVRNEVPGSSLGMKTDGAQGWADYSNPRLMQLPKINLPKISRLVCVQ